MYVRYAVVFFVFFFNFGDQSDTHIDNQRGSLLLK